MPEVDADAWPACALEPRAWRTNPDQRGPSGNRPSRADRMLTEITVEIPGEIAGRMPALPGALSAEIERAVSAVARVEARAEHLSGLGELLTRSEAVASSKIERVYADLGQIARASIGAEASAGARSTIAASRALRDLDRAWSVGDVGHRSLLAAHGRLLEGDLLEGRFAGRYRPMQNWVGGSDFSPRGALHVPPPPDVVEPLMDDLWDFSLREDMPAVVQAALVHGQFEAIHPFTDGNGRIGRALIGAVYRRRGLTQEATVPVAAAMLADVDRYFDHLRTYRIGDPTPLVRYVIACTSTAAEAALESADRLADLPATWHARVTARRGSAARTLIDALVRTPVLDIERAEAACGMSRRRVYDALDQLAEAGVLDEITGASRSRVWVAGDVMTELADLEERIGHRTAPSRSREAERG